jgi:DNA-binding LacI/PurR family transcriptional regulator
MTTREVQTIADIARLAGVSKATVSRALNDSPLIAAETKERVRAIAREHAFSMNVPARRLSLKQSHAVAFVTYPYGEDTPPPDVFMLEIMSGVTTALHASDYDLLVVNVDPHDASWVRSYLESGRADGFILLSPTCTKGHLDALVEARAPFVVWGPAPADHTYCSVYGDSFAGGRIATEHLLERGRTRIAFVGGPTKEPEVQDRRRGYETALRDAGVELVPELQTYTDWERPDTVAAADVRALLERAPDVDAIFACSDLMAIAAIEVVREGGRRVPDDVAVVGYDDVSLARHGNPPLTTIRQNGPLAGKLLARSLVQFLQDGVVTSTTIPAELVVRESS